MVPVSVVILAKNEARSIGRTLQSLNRFTDDIVIVDNGSTDETISIARSFGCRVIETSWLGYGPTKNQGIRAAKYDWIFTLDADEVPDQEVLQDISRHPLSDGRCVYESKFRTYFGDKWIRFGEWGRDEAIIVFNRCYVQWSDEPVHETLKLPEDARVIRLKGAIHHYTINNEHELREKFSRYAALNAQKHRDARRSPLLKMWFAPAFNFVKNYVFRLGFLDGNEGFIIAKQSAYYTWLKYHLLRQVAREKRMA